MTEICDKCRTCARYTNLKGYGVCNDSKTEPCDRYCTEEELENEVQIHYDKLGMYTGD